MRRLSDKHLRLLGSHTDSAVFCLEGSLSNCLWTLCQPKDSDKEKIRPNIAMRHTLSYDQYAQHRVRVLQDGAQWGTLSAM